MPLVETAFNPATVPPPDRSAEPNGYVVEADTGDRIHFLDWDGPPGDAAAPAVLLIHGLGQTAWVWTAVARRLRRAARVVAMDIRGHGLSDAPIEDYAPDTLAADAIAVAEGAGLAAGNGVVLAGHGFGGAVAAWAAAALGERCAGLVLVDGGWEDIHETTDLEPDELVRELDEPPEVLRSMTAFLADRQAFDPATWDADQERAARATVVETHAGKVVPVTRHHALARSVDSLFAYRPAVVLPAVEAPIVALAAADDEAGHSAAALDRAARALEDAGRRPLRVQRFAADGHNLPRYRPAEVAAAILSVAASPSASVPR